jgi:hypothetical protein
MKAKNTSNFAVICKNKSASLKINPCAEVQPKNVIRQNVLVIKSKFHFLLAKLWLLLPSNYTYLYDKYAKHKHDG